MPFKKWSGLTTPKEGRIEIMNQLGINDGQSLRPIKLWARPNPDSPQLNLNMKQVRVRFQTGKPFFGPLAKGKPTIYTIDDIPPGATVILFAKKGGCLTLKMN